MKIESADTERPTSPRRRRPLPVVPARAGSDGKGSVTTQIEVLAAEEPAATDSRPDAAAASQSPRQPGP